MGQSATLAQASGYCPEARRAAGRRGGLASARVRQAQRAAGLAYARAWRERMRGHFDALEAAGAYGPGGWLK